MAGRKKKADLTAGAADAGAVESTEELAIAEEDLVEDEPVPEDEIICRLTQERRKVMPEEEVIQALIDQLHREYRVDLADMARDLFFRFSLPDESLGRTKSLTRRAALIVYQTGVDPAQRKNADIIRVVMVVKKGTRSEDKSQGVRALEDLLLYLGEQKDHLDLYGA
jgi:hypothetical protein